MGIPFAAMVTSKCHMKANNGDEITGRLKPTILCVGALVWVSCCLRRRAHSMASHTCKRQHIRDEPHAVGFRRRFYAEIVGCHLPRCPQCHWPMVVYVCIHFPGRCGCSDREWALLSVCFISDFEFSRKNTTSDWRLLLCIWLDLFLKKFARNTC